VKVKINNLDSFVWQRQQRVFSTSLLLSERLINQVTKPQLSSERVMCKRRSHFVLLNHTSLSQLHSEQLQLIFIQQSATCDIILQNNNGLNKYSAFFCTCLWKLIVKTQICRMLGIVVYYNNNWKETFKLWLVTANVLLITVHVC